MKLSDIKNKIKQLGSVSQRNAEDMLAELQSHRAGYVAAFYEALEHAARGPARGDRGPLRHALISAERHARALGLHGYDLFPRRRITQFLKRLDRLEASRLASLARKIERRQYLQAQLQAPNQDPVERMSMTRELREVDSEIADDLASDAEAALTVVTNSLMVPLVLAADAAIQPIGAVAEWIASALKSSRRWYTGGKVARGFGHVIEGFFSRESLARTGFETSWGVRFIVPGTAGFLGNIGPWVMLYSGQLRDYRTMSVPFRVNPGATLATDVATFTINRPGFGAGTALPLTSGYVDAARSKLLIGRDGIAYIRIGEWEGRGPYFTISAFIPLLPWMNITWNASIFSPGWAPLVSWSRPAVIWVRGQADWLWRQLSAPSRWMR